MKVHGCYRISFLEAFIIALNWIFPEVETV